MRKMWVIAKREYLASVKTKAFVISLVVMPLLMGGSVLLRTAFKDSVETTDKAFALVDRAEAAEVVGVLTAAAEAYNQLATTDKDGKQVKPRFIVKTVAAESAQVQNFELSERVRSGELIGFLEILPPSAYVPKDELEKAKPSRPKVVLRYHTNRPTYQDFSIMADLAIGEFLRARLAAEVGLTPDKTQTLVRPAVLESIGLSRKDASGNIIEGKEESQIASIMVPLVLTLLMFSVILMGSTPLMQSVVEEKMQRIAEVLLGSVPPFSLMLGKLIGMAGVSLTISLAYLGGGYWAAHQYGVAENLSPSVIVWFLVFQSLASIMFGSLFIAIGAACTEVRETHNLLWPVMLLATMPMFLLNTALREPNGPVVRGVSFIPFATPSMMVARLSSPPGLPLWEPAVAIVGVLATTLLCVYAAGRIFRVGILMQGKGAKFGEMLRWVVKG